MRPDGVPPRANPWVLAACITWVILLTVVGTRQFLRPGRNSVFPTYLAAGQAWREGRNIYQDNAFRYSPTVAAAFAWPATWPPALAALAWLILNAGAFVGATWLWARVFLPRPMTRGESVESSPTEVAILLLVATPMAVGSINNLQANPLVIALMLAAATATLFRRWNTVAACVVAATLWKIYPAALGLVLLVLYPRPLGWRLGVGLAVGLLLPFALQRPSYVLNSYHDWVSSLQQEDRAWRAQRDLIALWEYWSHWRLASPLVAATRLLGAVAVGTVTIVLRRTPPAQNDQRRLMLLLGLVITWIMLLGPNTESATYILLAPVVAWALLAGSLEGWALWLRLLAGGAYALELVAAAAIIFPGGKRVQEWGLQPLGAILIVVALVGWWRRAAAPPRAA